MTTPTPPLTIVCRVWVFAQPHLCVTAPMLGFQNALGLPQFVLRRLQCLDGLKTWKGILANENSPCLPLRSLRSYKVHSSVLKQEQTPASRHELEWTTSRAAPWVSSWPLRSFLLGRCFTWTTLIVARRGSLSSSPSFGHPVLSSAGFGGLSEAEEFSSCSALLPNSLEECCYRNAEGLCGSFFYINTLPPRPFSLLLLPPLSNRGHPSKSFEEGYWILWRKTLYVTLSNPLTCTVPVQYLYLHLYGLQQHTPRTTVVSIPRYIVFGRSTDRNQHLTQYAPQLRRQSPAPPSRHHPTQHPGGTSCDNREGAHW